MRIILMVFIISHHYVVNSGVLDCIAKTGLTSNAVFLELWGMWGKTCINAFVMITGYFMCRSRLTWVKIAKLFGEIYFWKLLLSIPLIATGYMGLFPFAKCLIAPFRSMGNSFTSSFLMMYLLIPFINRLISALSKHELKGLILLLLFPFTFSTTFLASGSAFHEVGWYVTLYLVAAYIRLYPKEWFSDIKFTGKFLAISVAASILSVLLFLFLTARFGVSDHAYYLVADSGKLFAFLTGVAIFLFFNSLQIGTIAAVNTVASTVFGVLLIHAHSDAMRTWLWQDVLDVTGHYLSLNLPMLVLYSSFVVIAIFVVCSLMDWLRIVLVERPLFNWIRFNQSSIELYWRGKFERIRSRIPNALQ